MGAGFNRVTRRQFLRGGGAVLALPLLPSLLPSDAFAQAVAPKRIFFATFDHNVPNSKWLDAALAVQPVGSDGARQLILSSHQGAISPTMTHATYESLKQAGKITMARGIDNMIMPAGHGSFFLTGALGVGTSTSPLFPSVDTIMEASTKVYPAGTPSYVKRVIRCNGSQSFQKTGSNVVRVPGYENPIQLYNDLFTNFPGGGGAPPQPPSGDLVLQASILNKVFSAYQSVRGSRRISSTDRLRLEEHMTMINEVEQSIRELIEPPPVAACTVPVRPTFDSSYRQKIEIYLKLVTAAFKCGISKVGTIGFDSHGIQGGDIPGLPAGINLHNGVYHSLEGTTFTVEQANNHYVTWKKFHMDLLAQHLIGPLNVEEPGTGRTYLDNSMVVMLSESGMATEPGLHLNYDYQPVIFGTMGGFLRGDRMVAFERRVSTTQYDNTRYGIPYNQMLITFLQAMGLNNTDYRQDGVDGFGSYAPILPPNYASYQLSEYNDTLRRVAIYRNYYGHRFTNPISEIVA